MGAHTGDDHSADDPEYIASRPSGHVIHNVNLFRALCKFG
jgi:hypothetical protein